MENEEEVFVDIPGYEGIYQISSLGNIKSFHATGMMLKPWVGGRGYFYVGLCKNGKVAYFCVHVLIAIVFLGHKPNGMERVVNHIDGNKLNNNRLNIELVTNRENITTCFRRNMEAKTSKYIGVSSQKNRSNWRSAIKINGKLKHLGMFKSEIAASNAYQKALSKHNGTSFKPL